MATITASKKSSVPNSSNYWGNYQRDQSLIMECQHWQSKDQSYEGTILGDSFHGSGTYKWKEKSCVYEGSFYSNSKEGYAILSMPNNSSFEGLFIKNQPFGPGILTYGNGRQDVGFWLGRKLVRLSRPVDYIIPRLAPTLAGKIKLLQFKRLTPLSENVIDSVENILNKTGCGTIHFSTPFSKKIYDYRSIFFDRFVFEANRFMNCNDVSDSKTIETSLENVEENLTEVFGSSNSTFVRHICNDDAFFGDFAFDLDDLCTNNDEPLSEGQVGILTHYTKHGNLDELFETDLFMQEFFDDAESVANNGSIIVEVKGPEGGKRSPPKILLWNRGDLCTEMVKQIYRHRALEGNLNFNVTELMSGIRSAYRKTGEKEMKCLYFLKMCSLGPPHVVKELLCDDEISEELTDGRGNNGLMFAAATDQREIIDILSDYGVDVNAFNDENLTPLNLCLLRRLSVRNRISNWEVSFLPPGTNEEDENLKIDDWQDNESIESLDRVFGDGMSVYDSKNVELVKFRSSDKIPKETDPIAMENSSSELTRDITILNLKNVAEECEESLTGKSSPNNSLSSENTDRNAETTFITKSNKREEFLKSIERHSGKEKYLFNLKLTEILPAVEKERKASIKDRKAKKNIEKMVEEKAEEKANEEEIDLETLKMLNEIDKTIDKLLRRGADPDISEVPKPSLHLAIFSENLFTLENLLRFGADPNRRLRSSEGLLTPLHVLVLLQPMPHYSDMCKLLLCYGADPEAETEPDFTVMDKEKSFLSEYQGRTPLQLLCMRPDIEHGDPQGHVIDMALILAEVSEKRHFYKGHSYLTLAMLFGNIRLIEAFLRSGYFDPNQILIHGTPLHVLVSSDLQKKTLYENSLKMCQLLLEAGADPWITVESLSGAEENCVEYGRGQINMEISERQMNEKNEKSTANSEKSGGSRGGGRRSGASVRDHIKDHIKVVDYLEKVAEPMKSVTLTETRGSTNESRGKAELGDKSKHKSVSKKDGTGQSAGETEADKRGAKKTVKTKAENEKQKNKYSATKLSGKSGSKSGEKSVSISVKNRGSMSVDKSETKWSGKSGTKSEKSVSKWGEKSISMSDEKSGTKSGEKPPLKFDEKFAASRSRVKSMSKTGEKFAAFKFGKKSAASKRGEKFGAKSDREKVKADLKRKTEGNRKLFLTDLNDLKISDKRIPTQKETSEKFLSLLLKSSLEKFGRCVNTKADPFQLPYVVLRDGNFYYKFLGGKPRRKEQYSLV